MAGKTLADWTEADLARWLNSQRQLKATLPASHALQKIEATQRLVVSDQLQLSPQAFAYLRNTNTDRKTTTKAVNTTTTATDLLNGEITIPGGTLGATGAIRLTAYGDWLNNTGASQILPRFQLRFGVSTPLDTGVPAGTVSTNVNRSGWKIEATINNTSVSTQFSSLSVEIATISAIASTSTAFVAGEGIYQSVSTGATSQMVKAIGVSVGSTVDTSIDQPLVLNVINGALSSSYETRLFAALVEIL